MAVESALQGMGWGSRLYEALLSVIDGPVLTFARIDSPGASLIEKAYPKAGFRLHRLRDCHLFAGMPSRARSGGDWKLTKDEAADACRGPELISCPDRTEERHWQADPRRRERWRLECEEDKVAADILWQPVRQAGGRIVESVTLERVRVEGNGARGLQALLSRLSGHGDVIQATNLSAIPLEELGKSGWRKIGPGFQCWIAYRETDAFASSTDLPDATNADVV